jgi:peptidoglycan/xylan/chitin deacetylase (PgdA/CDA1 family)
MAWTPPHVVRRRRLIAVVSLGVAFAVVPGVAVYIARGGDGRAGRANAARAGRGSRSADPTARRDLGRPGPPRPVPILMYHVTASPPAGAPYPDLYVSKAEFADHMTALRRAGYVAVTEQEVWDAWHHRGPLPRHPVVVSIDDGYRSNYRNARPVLRRIGWPAVLDLELRNLAEPDYGLTERQIQDLIADGWEIDSHTIDHVDLTTVDDAQLTHEVHGSRAELKRRFGVPANFFCYPAGRYDARVIAAVRKAGYVAATSVEPGLAQPDEAARFHLARVRVHPGVSGTALVAELSQLGDARARP